jgi:leader peptidase (prepilin peptidase) / N-methyltransferase
VTGDGPTAVAQHRRREVRIAAVGVAALGVALCVARFGLGARSLVGVPFICVLITLSVIDLETRLLPNRIVLPAAVAALLAQIALFPDRLLESIVASVGGALLLFIPALVSPGALGMGDVKLVLLLGAVLGRAIGFSFFVASFVGLAVALVLLSREGRGALKSSIPFGPALAAGGIVALLVGDDRPVL